MGDESEAPDGRRPKDRLIQARVPRDLEASLRREAHRRRLTVSHLIRNVLEDTFQLVDDVVANVDELVSDSVELARRVGHDARRVARAVRGEEAGEAEPAPRPGEERQAGAPCAEEPEAAAADPLAHVVAWNPVVLNRATACAACGREVGRGAQAWVGLSEDPEAARAWLCAECVGSLRAGPGSEGEGESQ